MKLLHLGRGLVVAGLLAAPATRRIGAQAAEIGLPVEILPAWYDVDDRASLRRLVAEVLQGYRPGPERPALHPAPATAAFLRDAPDWIADWTGFRPDSAPPIEGGEMIIDWWRSKGRNPQEKLLVFSDALDVETIETAYRHFHGRARMSFGWGTNLTNDFAGCAPKPIDQLGAISLVCKVKDANGRPAVKLSDNINKAMGEPGEIARYLKVFGAQGRVEQPVLV